jgi:hypothetical protein
MIGGSKDVWNVPPDFEIALHSIAVANVELVSGEDTRNTCSKFLRVVSAHCFFSDLRDKEVRGFLLIS